MAIKDKIKMKKNCFFSFWFRLDLPIICKIIALAKNFFPWDLFCMCMTERNKKNRKKGKVPFEPEEGIPFVDVHCHIPWKKRRKGFIEPEVIYQKFKESYGKFMITSAIDWKS